MAERDELRLLHRDPARGYTSDPSRAARNEPEALSRDDLELIAARGHTRELDAWQLSRRRLQEELDTLRLQVHSPHVTRAARAIERELAALHRKLIA